MIVVGLTGGIGSGKSTVSGALRDRGAVIVDADAIVRELQRPGTPVLAAMVERFGSQILTPDGELARARLAQLVFDDAEAIAALNAIVHPAVHAEITSRLAELASTDRVVVLDIPLLVENDRYPVAGVIVVDTPEDVAVARVVAQRGMSEADAWARVSRQASRDERLARADFVVDNAGTPDQLEGQLDDLWRWILTLEPVENVRSSR